MDTDQDFIDFLTKLPSLTINHDESRLHFAARSGRRDAVQKLLDEGADPNLQDEDGRTPLHSAVEAGATAAMEALLKHPATNYNARMHDGATPLILASRLTMQCIFEALVNANVDLNAADNDGKTALHWVVNDRDAEEVISFTLGFVRMLLDSGADANAQDKDGRTPLHLALETTAPVVSRLLLRYPSTNPNAKMHDGTTPLIIAVGLGSTRIIGELIEVDADVNVADNRGVTALHKAVNTSNPRIVDRLLRIGAKVDASDAAGQTPLHYAAKNGSAVICRMLLANYADRDLRDYSRRMPVDLALEMNLPGVVQLLVKERMPAG